MLDCQTANRHRAILKLFISSRHDLKCRCRQKKHTSYASAAVTYLPNPIAVILFDNRCENGLSGSSGFSRLLATRD